MASTNAATIVPILQENIDKRDGAMADEAGQYKFLSFHFDYDFVRHGQSKCGRGDVGTNTIEGYFSIFKREMKDVYQHCSERHLHRYLVEFDFRYNNRATLEIDDDERADRMLVGIVGKRILYRDSSVR